MPPLILIRDDHLRLRFLTRAELEEFFVRAEAQHGFLLELETEPRLHSETRLVAASGELEQGWRARVIQCFPGGEGRTQVAFELLGRAPVSQAPEVPIDPPPASPRPQEGGAGPTGADELPVVRLKKMNTSEKMRLASSADRAERQILLRDRSPQVLLALLNNPRLEDKEVLEMVKSHHCSPGLLQRLAKDRRWGSSYEVQTAIVKNPKTPTPLALRLVEGLRRPELRGLARSSNVREAVKRAALRAYERRR